MKDDLPEYLTDPDAWSLSDKDKEETFYMATPEEREKLFNESLSGLKTRVRKDWAKGWANWEIAFKGK